MRDPTKALGFLGNPRMMPGQEIFLPAKAERPSRGRTAQGRNRRGIAENHPAEELAGGGTKTPEGNRYRAIAALMALCLLGGCAIKPPLPRSAEHAGARPALITRRPTPELTPEPTLEPVIVETLAEPEPTPRYVPPFGAFVPGDLRMMGIRARSGVEEVIGELGEPPMREDHTEELTGLKVTTLAYDGLYAEFVGGNSLTGMTVTSKDWPGPRGLRVGASLEEVLKKFRVKLPDRDSSIDEANEAANEADDRLSGADTATLYADIWPDGRMFPPMAELSRDVNENGAYVLRLIAPVEPCDDADLDSGAYYYRQHACCSFFFDAKSDKLVRIHWFVGALAE